MYLSLFCKLALSAVYTQLVCSASATPVNINSELSTILDEDSNPPPSLNYIARRQFDENPFFMEYARLMHEKRKKEKKRQQKQQEPPADSSKVLSLTGHN